jgi:DNA-binding GntR family transcriptional regulator
VEQLRDDIASVRLAPGQRLVEAELVRQLGVSRGPLRQALDRLIAEGLVVSEHHRGVSVRPMTREDLRHLYEVREALEGQAAALAAARSEDPDVRAACTQRLRELREHGKASGTEGYVEELRQHDRFHDTIAEVSGNPFLYDVIHHMRPLLSRAQVRGALAGRRARASMSEHEGVFVAILAGDVEEAERAMRAHIRASSDALLALPDSVFR